MSLQASMSKLWKAMVYYIKFFLFGVWMLCSVIIIPLMYRKPGHYDNKLVLGYYSELISRIMGIRWTVKGSENIITDEGAVVVMNHQSFIDALGTKPLVKQKVFTHFVSKKEIWYILPMGIILWLSGSVFIDRSHKKQALETLNKLSLEIIKEKKRVLIFPEGTRHYGHGFLPFKKGAFHTAISAQVPIQPIVMGKYKFLDHKTPRFDSGEGMISILPPIPTVGLKPEDVNCLVQKTTDIMLKEYEALNKSD